MRFSNLLSFLLFLSFLAAPPALFAQQSAAPDFNALRKTWIQDLEGRKLGPAIALYAGDAMFINADGSHVTGDGLRKLFETVFTNFRARITMTSRASAFSGVLAYDSGNYDETITVAATGEQKHLTGDYLTVYRRGAVDKWLIVQQVWTQAPEK